MHNHSKMSFDDTGGEDLQMLSHLLHNRSQPPQSQATFIASCDHSASQFDYNPFSMTEFTAVCKGASICSPLWNCTGR